MKKWLVPACIVIVLLMGSAVMLTKETNKKYVINRTGGTLDYLWQRNAGVQPSGNIVTIPLDVNLVRLENQTDSAISQFCGTDLPNIKIDSALLAVLDQAQLKQGIVTSPQNINISQQMPNITFNSGKPVSEVSNQGTGNLTVNCPDREKFTLYNLGTGNVTIGDNYIKNVDVQNRGTGNVLFTAYKISTANVDTRGTGSVSFNDVEVAMVSLYGTGDVTFANSPKITSTVKGLGRIKTKTLPPVARTR